MDFQPPSPMAKRPEQERRPNHAFGSVISYVESMGYIGGEALYVLDGIRAQVRQFNPTTLIHPLPPGKHEVVVSESEGETNYDVFHMPVTFDARVKGGRFWRIVGELFRRDQWLAKGYIKVTQRAEARIVKRYAVELKRLGLRASGNHYRKSGSISHLALDDNLEFTISFYIGYDARRDVLYISMPHFSSGMR